MGYHITHLVINVATGKATPWVDLFMPFTKIRDLVLENTTRKKKLELTTLPAFILIFLLRIYFFIFTHD